MAHAGYITDEAVLRIPTAGAYTVRCSLSNSQLVSRPGHLRTIRVAQNEELTPLAPLHNPPGPYRAALPQPRDFLHLAKIT